MSDMNEAKTNDLSRTTRTFVNSNSSSQLKLSLESRASLPQSISAPTMSVLNAVSNSAKDVRNPRNSQALGSQNLIGHPMMIESDRETWNKKVDFLLSVIGFAVDLSNGRRTSHRLNPRNL